MCAFIPELLLVYEAGCLVRVPFMVCVMSAHVVGLHCWTRFPCWPPGPLECSFWVPAVVSTAALAELRRLFVAYLSNGELAFR